MLCVLYAAMLSCGGNLAKEKERSVEPAPSASNAGNAFSDSLRKKPWNDRLIAPGVGTDSVRLNMSRDELVTLLGEPDEEYDHTNLCNFSEIHWFPPTNPDGSVDGDGIFAFFREGKIFEIRFGEGFHTSRGVNHQSSLEDLKKEIAAPLFELTNSANTATNYENLFFMIEKEKGIAYEVAAGYKTIKRRVSAFYVFYPTVDFLPWGCIDENQRLVEISSLSK